MERVVIKKNGRERIEIGVAEYGGKQYLDIRAYYFDADANEWKPTKKGIAIAPDLVKPVLRGIKKVGAPFLELPEPESTGIERKAKKKKKSDKEQRKLQKEMTAAVRGDDLDDDGKAAWESVQKRLKAASKVLKRTLAGAVAEETGVKKKKKNGKGDMDRLIEIGKQAGVKAAMKSINKKLDKIERDAPPARSIKKSKLKSKSKTVETKVKKKKLKEEFAPSKKHKRPNV